MKKTRKSIGIFFVSLVLVSLFASTAFAATVQHSFSFNIQSMTSGTNYHPYAKGSCRITATARTIDPWDGSEQFKVALKKDFYRNKHFELLCSGWIHKNAVCNIAVNS